MARRMRVAFVGKGGAGKSTIAGTFARLLARAGEPVLAVDSDPLPGLPYALGIAVDDRPIPDGVVVAGPEGGPRWVLAPDLDAEGFVESWAKVCPDGVRYLQFGNLWGHVATLQRAQHAWSQVVRELDPDRWHLVGDLPGGTRQAMFGWARYAEIVCVIVEPTDKSVHSARRLLNLAAAPWAPDQMLVVANKVRESGDVSRLSERLGTAVELALPEAPEILAGDRHGVAPLDAAPLSDFVDSVGTLLARVRNLAGQRAPQPATEGSP